MFKSLLQNGVFLCLLLSCIVSSFFVNAQTTRTGKVIGDDQQPIAGASIVVKGTNNGTQTNAKGEFNLTLKSGDVLKISYIGFQPQEITYQGAFFVTTLKSSSNNLNEVVVTGYTTQRKKDITGAVATVNISDAKKIPVTSSEQLLQGQASGVTVINQGAPGASSSVFVRGITNFGNSTPLYVVDGVQTDNMSQVNPSDIESISVLKDAGSAAIYGVSGGNGVIVVTTKKGKPGKIVFSYDAYFGTQQPLKGNVWHIMSPTQQSKLAFQANDAGQEAIYPGGAGVLPVYGYHQAPLPSISGVTNDPAIEKSYFFDPTNSNNNFLVQKFNQTGTDWYHSIFRAAPQQSHTLTASGGSDKSTFLYSLQYLDQQGTMLGSFEKRYQARVNNTYSGFNNHIRFGESAFAYYRENNGGGSLDQQKEDGSISETYRIMPIIPTHDIAGNYGGAFTGPKGDVLGNAENPLAMRERAINDRNKTLNIQGTVFAEVDLLKHFTLRSAFGGNIGNTFYYYTTYIPYNNAEGYTNPNAYFTVSQNFFRYNFTNSILYKQNFGKHSLSVFAGYELKENGGQQLGATATNFPTLDPTYLTLAGTTNAASISFVGTKKDPLTSLYQPTATVSQFARLDYSYNDKYLLGATIRRDSYSSFAAGRQTGVFPSVSLGWRISQEDFLKSVTWLNDLKLRASYGSTGSNANVTGTNAINTYNYGPGTTAYGINGGLSSTTTGYAITGLGNPNTTWETDKILNVGLDAALFNHLVLDVEYYKKSISGLLFPLQLPSTAGAAASPTVNVGDVQNTGLDFSATYNGNIGNDFKFSIGGTITSFKNKITSLSSPGYFDLFNTGSNTASRIGSFVREQVGQPIGSFYGYKIKGIYQNPGQVSSANVPGYAGAAPGSYIYQDVNGDGKIDDNDKTFIGNPNPNFTYGVNLNASYLGFDFSMVLYGSHGNKDFNYVKYWTDTYHSFPGGKNIELLTKSAIVDPNTQTVTNPGATLPALTFSQPLGSTVPSSFYVENGSFLKCRVAQLGYNFASGILKNVGITNLHVYVQGTNLFTITKYTGPDPELVPSLSNTNPVGSSTPQQSASSGVDWGAYPNNQKTYILGVNLTF